MSLINIKTSQYALNRLHMSVFFVFESFKQLSDGLGLAMHRYIRIKGVCFLFLSQSGI